MFRLSDPSAFLSQPQATPDPHSSLRLCLLNLSLLPSLGSECQLASSIIAGIWFPVPLRLACSTLPAILGLGAVSPEEEGWEDLPSSLVVHSISGLAPDYLFQTQFAALPRAAASLKHVTQLPPSLPGPQSWEFSMGSLPGPDSCQLGDGGPARSIEPGTQL